MKPLPLFMGYLKKHAGLEPYTRGFSPTYTKCWSRSRLVVPLAMIVDSTLISCLSWRALSLSIESSNSLSELFPPRISWHASCFSESVPSVSQSRFAIKRGKSLYFKAGLVIHEIPPSIDQSREYASSQHIANEKSVHPGHFVPQSKCLLIDPYSFGQSLHGVFTPLY